MDKLNYKLCYIEEIDEYTAYKLYFTDNLEKQWGDDWNDRPANCNAEPPYDDETSLTSIYVEFPYSFYSELVFGGKTYSVQDINNGVAPWLLHNTFSINGGMTLSDFIKVMNNIEDIKIYIELGDEDSASIK